MARLVMLMVMPATMLLLQVAGAQEQTGLEATWELATPEAQFPPRDTAEPVVFDGRMWLSNGYYHGNVHYPDLWMTEDGETWERLLGRTPFGKRGYGETLRASRFLWMTHGRPRPHVVGLQAFAPQRGWSHPPVPRAQERDAQARDVAARCAHPHESGCCPRRSCMMAASGSSGAARTCGRAPTVCSGSA